MARGSGQAKHCVQGEGLEGGGRASSLQHFFQFEGGKTCQANSVCLPLNYARMAALLFSSTYDHSKTDSVWTVPRDSARLAAGELSAGECN